MKKSKKANEIKLVQAKTMCKIEGNILGSHNFFFIFSQFSEYFFVSLFSAFPLHYNASFTSL